LVVFFAVEMTLLHKVLHHKDATANYSVLTATIDPTVGFSSSDPTLSSSQQFEFSELAVVA
jgi:hypothetical protein